MATFRNRGGKWQARIQIKGHAAPSKTFINKVDAERWAKQVEVEMQKGSYNNLVLAEEYVVAVAKRNHPEQNYSALNQL